METVKNHARVVASLDMGTTKVSAIMGEVRDRGVRIIGIGTTPSEGLKQGVVIDINRAAESVATAVAEAERMSGVTVRRYNVGVAGEHVRSMNSRGVVAIPNLDDEISENDVTRALNAARSFSLPYDREVIHTLPQEYIVDQQSGIKQASGMYGSRLEARVHVVTASRPALDNLAKTLDITGLEVGELVLEPLASSYAVLTEDEKEIGVMLIDIGGGTTDVMTFREGGVTASGVIGIGGSNVTSDVAYGLRTSMKAAEEIKIRYGCAVSGMIGPDEKIEVPGIGFRESRRVSRQLLAGIIEPRMTELFILINDQITKSGFKRSLGAGVVLSGGSSMLAGTRELAEQIFDLPVRIGAPIAIDGLSEAANHPMHATGVGLLLYGGGSEARGGERTASAGWWRQSLAQLRRAIASFI